MILYVVAVDICATFRGLLCYHVLLLLAAPSYHVLLLLAAPSLLCYLVC